jgi:NAD-dependent SIR2 family protein deacetylase
MKSSSTPVLTLEEAKPRLREAYRQRQLIPFLGAGFSAPLGLPQWGELMGWMGEPLGFDPTLFELNGTPLQLAGYYELENEEGLTPFIARMRERFHAPEVEARRALSAQHQALARLDLRRIYTTNFEHHIERALLDGGKKVDTLVRIEDFMRPTEEHVCQVVKFHGDLDHEDSVVLTERQFFDRMRLDAAPDQYLRADLLGNVFLFLGYSFSDPNIRDIWHRMERLRREVRPGPDGSRRDQRSFLATFGAGVVQPRLLQELHIDMIELDARDKTRSVVELLDAIGGT